jgi:hypothetical protein
MKKSFLVVALSLLSIFAAAQDKTFHMMAGQNPQSSEFRVRYNLARRTHTQIASLPGTPFGDDWSTSLTTGGAMLLNQWPSTWGLDSLNSENPSCTSNYAEFNTNATPSATQANVVLYSSIFRGTAAAPGLCGTGNPTVYAAYNLGTTPLNGSSATWSFEGASKGTAFAILEREKALIHIVTLSAGGTLTAPIAPTEVTIDFTNITNTNCTAGAVHTADHSNVWVDYSTDEAYVGDDAGKLYHITGIFNGTHTMDFCTIINGGAYMQSPVHIGKIAGVDYVWVMTNGKRLYRVQVNAARTGFSNSTNTIISSIVGGVFDDGIYDTGTTGTTVTVYQWTNHDQAGTQASLYQIDGLATPMTFLAELNLGPVENLTTGTYNGLYVSGDFDNNFETNGAGGANATGYTLVYPSGQTSYPELASYQFTSAGVISGFTAMTGNSKVNVNLTTSLGNVETGMIDVYDPIAGVDQLFVGTGNGTTTNSNRLSRWDITTPLTSNTDAPTVTVATVDGGTSGIVIDYNDSGLGADTQNIYFSELATPLAANRCGQTAGVNNSCAVKLQQAGLN